MTGDQQPGELYWSLVEPIWRSISIYAPPDEFLTQFAAVRPAVGHLFAAHWCQSEVRNGGLHQFFGNPTGILAPEARDGFRAVGIVEWADILDEAMQFFGDPYPRVREDRLARLLPLMREHRGARQQWDPFYTLDERFYRWLHAGVNRWERAADTYAAADGIATGTPAG
jgi:hypothetical protein